MIVLKSAQKEKLWHLKQLCLKCQAELLLEEDDIINWESKNYNSDFDVNVEIIRDLIA